MGFQMLGQEDFPIPAFADRPPHCGWQKPHVRPSSSPSCRTRGARLPLTIADFDRGDQPGDPDSRQDEHEIHLMLT
jgi:hypothetical protein